MARAADTGAVPTIRSRIAAASNQAEHHKQLSFEEEFIALLERYGIEYDPQFVFD